jgi:hypothetical protein
MVKICNRIMNKRIILICLSAALVLISWQLKEVKMNSLLGEMTGRGNLSYFPREGFSLRQFSSYNRASLTPGKEGWFANQDMSHFIRVENNNGHREFVMFDTTGPGVIVRWWMTFYKAQEGVLRVYIDNDSVPVIKGRPDEILSGKRLASGPLAISVQAGAELGDAGRDYDHNLYVPIPFRRRCKITYECNLIVMRNEDEGVPVSGRYYWPDVFYNIDYRAYSKVTAVESFSPAVLKKAGPLLKAAGESLLYNQVRSDEDKTFDKDILPGDSLTLEVKSNQAAINRLMIELTASDIPQALRSSVIKASFDGYQTIWAPVGEFFGTGYNPGPHKTWMNQRDENGKMESFWVMPFRQKCTLSIINYGSENIHVKGLAGIISYKWDKSSMYFGSSWHEYYHIKSRSEKGKPFDLNFIDITGKGVYVGDQVSLFNNTYQWWGEGDEKIFVDSEKFPSSFGTGSEDYYGYSFARQESFSHPFISQPVGTGNMSWGVTVNMRHRSLDRIPFNTGISSNIELWHWADIRMNYSLTSFYYIMPPFKVNIRPDIESVRNKVAIKKGDITNDKN